MGFPVQNKHVHAVPQIIGGAATTSGTSLNISYLIGIGSSHPYGVKQIFKAVRYRPEVQSHLVGHQCVSVVKQVNVTPSQWTVFLQKIKKKKKG